MLLWPYRLHITTWIIKVSITLIKIINKNNERERERMALIIVNYLKTVNLQKISTCTMYIQFSNYSLGTDNENI